jgi:hypothetical protein
MELQNTLETTESSFTEMQGLTCHFPPHSQLPPNNAVRVLSSVSPLSPSPWEGIWRVAPRVPTSLLYQYKFSRAPADRFKKKKGPFLPAALTDHRGLAIEGVTGPRLKHRWGPTKWMAEASLVRNPSGAALGCGHLVPTWTMPGVWKPRGGDYGGSWGWTRLRRGGMLRALPLAL